MQGCLEIITDVFRGYVFKTKSKHTFLVIPVSGRSAPNPANRSTVLLRSSELGPFSDTSPHR